MRLPPNLVELISKRMVNNLLEKGVISSEHPSKTVEKVNRLILADLAIEQEIDEEARQILLDHQEEIKGAEDLEFHRLMLKLKSELAAKRGYVI